MGSIVEHRPVLLLLAAFSRYDEAIDWAQRQAGRHWGEVALASDRFRHDETDYYRPTMGTDLKKTFFVFDSLIDPAQLPDKKIEANRWEEEYRQSSDWPESRPLNLDPGYLTQAKLVLASTKDRDHRLYLDKGIFAEGTLYYRGGSWQKRDWTYPDYQRADYHEFFTRCRDFYRHRIRGAAAGDV